MMTAEAETLREQLSRIERVADLGALLQKAETSLTCVRERLLRARHFDMGDGWQIVYQHGAWRAMNTLIDGGAELAVDGETRTFEEEDTLPDALFDFSSAEAAEVALGAWCAKREAG